MTYEGFGGEVRTTFAESTPWWPARRPSAKPGAPNVIVVLADDLGFSDVGCFGSEIPTPNIDALAANGVRLTNFRVTPLCSPSRAALMTGLNAHAAGIGFPTQIDPGFPGYVSELPANQPTMPEIFRANGYATLMVGKWHLCKEEDFAESGSRHSWPLQRGFDQFYGFLEALTNFHHPHRLYEGNSVVEVDEYPDGYYLTDDLTDRAVRMIRGVTAADPDKPFFLYFAHGAVHAPIHAKASDVARHRGAYDDGWDEIRERRLDKQIRLGVMPEGTTLPPRNSEAGHAVDPWDGLNDRERTVFARYMEVYAAMVDSMDQSMGRLRDVLAETGQLDNTIILFTSDNGAARLTDAGQETPDFATTNDTGTCSYFGYIQQRGEGSHVTEELVSTLDSIGGPTTWPHYPRGWAMACNTPFRLYKFSTLRGGQQAPCVLSWPAGLPAQHELRGQYTHITDVLPTLVDLIGLDVPPAPNEPAGASFAPVLTDPASPPQHTEQYTECVGNRAFYRDGWEIVTVRRPLTPFSEEHWALFDVANDPTQSTDLADQHPELVRELIKGFDKAAWANQVYPLDEGSGVKHLQRPGHTPPGPVTVHSGTPTLERHRSSQLIDGCSFRIVVDWRYRRGDQGVLVAHGDQAAGYVLYVEDGMLCLEHNEYGIPRPLPPMPLGDTAERVVVDVSAPGGGVWDVSVLVDGQIAMRSTRVRQLAGFLPFEGIDVGIDRRSPVSWRLYEKHGAFPFTGGPLRVSYVPGERAPDAPERRLAQARAVGAGLQ